MNAILLISHGRHRGNGPASWERLDVELGRAVGGVESAMGAALPDLRQDQLELHQTLRDAGLVGTAG